MSGQDDQELKERVLAGDLRLYELGDHADAKTAMNVRRQVLEDECSVALDGIGSVDLQASAAEANIENMIGTAEVPMGVTGPLPVSGTAAVGEYYLPLATTEGALVASINRGCSTVRAGDGATTRIIDRGMTRAPVFTVEGVAEAETTIDWVQDNSEEVREAAEDTTGHGELLAVDPYVAGDNVFFRFAYDTKDAMGMNMATIATEAACDVIEAETPASLVALSGNLCSDKKPAAINAIEGRGRTVVAETTIPNSVVAERLGTSADSIAAVNTRKNLVGSAKAGALGFNAHASNVIAAAFLATGQDAAQVVEGANTMTTVDVRDDALYASVTLPSLEVGTVGGGTGLPTQQEALELLGVAGGGDPPGSNGDELAEIIAAGTLAGELSLLSALASRHLSSAHAELGR